MKMKKYLICIFTLILFCSGSCDKGGTDPMETDPTISIADVTKFEGDANSVFDFNVTLSKSSTKVVSVSYATEEGSATSEDFNPTSGTLTFAAGETSKAISVSIIGDDQLEIDETFTVRLSNPTNATLSATSAEGAIRNDDDGEVSIPETGYSTPLEYPGMTLLWQDEFDGTELASHWVHELGNGCPNLCGWGNNELQSYQESNTSLVEGNLVIEANEQGSIYRSSRIITKDQFEFKFGRVDIRASLPEGQGIWPALWMLGANIDVAGWPACGEIDIMELIGHEPSTIHGTAHFGANPSNHRFTGMEKTLTNGKFIDEFHVFSIVWEENKIEWFMDDQSFFTITPAEMEGQPYPFNEDFFFIINCAVGGNWPGNPNESTLLPQYLIVDYIRVFQ